MTQTATTNPNLTITCTGPRTDGRQTCSNCLRVVGTLCSGGARPYTSDIYVDRRFPDRRVFHSCADTAACEAHRNGEDVRP